MIAIEEVRVGNWFEFVVHRAPNVFSILNIDQLVYFSKKPEMFIPIPLTEEILLKCGFIKNFHADSEIYFDIKSSDIVINKTDAGFIFYQLNIIITYLHELQNLYYDLEKKQLPFNN